MVGREVVGEGHYGLVLALRYNTQSQEGRESRELSVVVTLWSKGLGPTVGLHLLHVSSLTGVGFVIIIIFIV